MSDALRDLKDNAVELASKGKIPAALEAWIQVTRLAPEDLAARQKVGELLAKLGRKAEAVAAYEAVAARYAKQGLFYKASAVCRVLVTLDPGHQRTQELIATLYAQAPAASPMSSRTLPAASLVQAQKPAAPVAVAPAAPVVVAPAATVVAAGPAEFELDLSLEPAPTEVPASFPRIPLFSTLNHEELLCVLNEALEVRTFAPGVAVVTEGEPGDSMFALAEGTAIVTRGLDETSRRTVATLGAGDVFGEAAMVSGAPRLASVLVETDAVVLEFRRDAMAKVISRHPGVGQAIERFYRDHLLANVLRASPILRALPPAGQAALAGQFQPINFDDGQAIVTEGTPATAVFLLLRGRCAVTHSGGERYPDLVEGDLFGEVSVLSHGAATASVAAIGPVLALRLPAADFKALVLKDGAAMLAVMKLAKSRLARTARLDELADDRRI